MFPKFESFEELIKDFTSGNEKIFQSDYQEEGSIPIIDQGQALIAGFTDDSSKICNVDLPCIVFGDHTRVFKYVDFPFALGADGVKVLKPSEKLYPKYVYYFLSQCKLRGKPGYNRNYKYLKMLIVPTPPISEQKRIADILDKADSLRQKRKESIALLDELLKSVFIDMFGDPVRNEKKLPLIKLGDIANLAMGGTPNTKNREYYGGTINWMKSGDIKGDFVYSVENKLTEEGLHSSNAKIYEENSVVIALNGQGKTRGTTAVLKVKSSSNQSVACISVNQKLLNAVFLHFNLKMRYKVLRNLTGDEGRTGLNLTLLRNFKIGLPSIDKQLQFEQIVQKIESMRIKNRESLLELNHQFNALLQRAFRGEGK